MKQTKSRSGDRKGGSPRRRQALAPGKRTRVEKRYGGVGKQGGRGSDSARLNWSGLHQVAQGGAQEPAAKEGGAETLVEETTETGTHFPPSIRVSFSGADAV